MRAIEFSARIRSAAVVLAAVAAPLVFVVGPAATSVVAADRHAAFVVDGNTGEVLRNEKGDEQRFPASLTKMMTLYLAFEAIEAGRASYTTRIRVSQEAASQPPTKLDLDPGETIPLIDAIKALITKSANDMAVAIAEHLGGSESRFAQIMTDKARLIGMSRTIFRNASGLPDTGQLSTARDMVTLGLRLQDDFPQHYHLFSIKSFAYGRSNYRNHNNLLNNFQGTEGIKTGYTRMSGFNLVASVRRGSRHVVGAVFGGASSSQRDERMRLILTQGFIKASPVKTRRPAPTLVAAARPVQRPQGVAEARQHIVIEPRQQVVAEPRQQVVAEPRQQVVAEPRQQVVAVAPAAPIQPPARPLPRAAVPDNADTGDFLQVASAALAAPDAASVPQPSSRIDVARVKPVMVPRVRQGDSNRQLAALQPMPVEAPAAVAPVAPVAAQSPRRPLPVAAAPSPLPVAPPPAVIAQVPAGQPVGRGAAPSTFGQQAANLARGGASHDAPAAQSAASVRFAQASAATPRSNLSGPSTYQPTSYQAVPAVGVGAGIAAGGFEIQIGAYASPAEADRALNAARTTASELLGSRQGRAVMVQKESRQFYRARFSGFDSKTAASTCSELRRRQIDCFVMKTE